MAMEEGGDGGAEEVERMVMLMVGRVSTLVFYNRRRRRNSSSKTVDTSCSSPLDLLSHFFPLHSNASTNPSSLQPANEMIRNMLKNSVYVEKEMILTDDHAKSCSWGTG